MVTKENFKIRLILNSYIMPPRQKLVVPPTKLIDEMKDEYLQIKILSMKNSVMYCYYCGYLWIRKGNKNPIRCANCNNLKYDVIKDQWQVLNKDQLNKDSNYHIFLKIKEKEGIIKIEDFEKLNYENITNLFFLINGQKNDHKILP